MIIDAELKKRYAIQRRKNTGKRRFPDLFWKFLRVKIFKNRKLQLAHIDLAW